MFEYDPYLKSEKQIIATFISGRKYLDELVDDLMPRNRNLSSQSVIITGPRGAGKSHFIKTFYYRIKNHETLKQFYLPVIFPEELFSAGSLYHFLREIVKRIFIEYQVLEDSGGGQEKAGKVKTLQEEYQRLIKIPFKGSKKFQEEQRNKIEDDLFALLDELGEATGKKAILLLENLQDLLGRKINSDGLKKFRAFLQQEHSPVLIIGTAVAVFDQIKKNGEPFYNFFKLRRLTGLSHEEVVELLRAESAARRDHKVLEHIKRQEGSIEVFRIITGGNPRLVLFLYDLLAGNGQLTVEDILLKITDLTPYFKAETESLSDARQMILVSLCDGPPAWTPTEIAQYLNEPLGIVSENLKRLLAEGKVRVVETRPGKDIKRSESFYSVADYFYRIWHQMRQSLSADESVRWMAELTALLFSESDLEERFANSSDNIKSVYKKALELRRDDAFTGCLQAMIKQSAITPEGSPSIYDGPDAAVESLYMGNSYLESGNHARAIECYQRALEIKPDMYEAHFDMGYAYDKLGDYARAIDCYQRAVEIKTDKDKAYYNMGIGYCELGDHARAKDCFQRASEIKPDFYEAFYNMGYAYNKLGDHAKAIGCYQRAVEKKPDLLEAYYNMGNSYSKLGDHAKAIDCYQKVVEIKPDKHEAYYNMGNSHSGLGDHARAIACYLKATAIKPDDYDAYYQLGQCYFNSEKYLDALSSFRNYILLSGDFKHKNKDMNVFVFMRKASIFVLREDEVIKRLVDSNELVTKVAALEQMIHLGKFNGVEAFYRSLLPEIKKDDILKGLKELYFAFMFETICRLNAEPAKIDPRITARCFLEIALLLNDGRSAEEKVNEFLLNYIWNINKEKINKNILNDIFSDWQEHVSLPEAVTAIFEALKDPTSRTAQVWSADPLFTEIIKKL